MVISIVVVVMIMIVTMLSLFQSHKTCNETVNQLTKITLTRKRMSLMSISRQIICSMSVSFL